MRQARYRIFGWVLMGAGVCAWAAPAAPAQNPGGGQVVIRTDLEEEGVDPKVDEILTRLEARKVQDLHARVEWKVRHLMDEEENADIKRGEIWYMTKDPVPVFMVKFDKRVFGGRADKIEEQHLFDGAWYVELRGGEVKTVTRREVRKPDDQRNPYRLGEGGPFPVPFGQSKEEIVGEFAVRLTPSVRDDPRNTDHVILTPRAESRFADKYETIEFWIERRGKEEGLPTQMRLTKKDGTGRVDSVITVTFSKVELDRGLSEGVFEVKTPVGWQEILEPLES